MMQISKSLPQTRARHCAKRDALRAVPSIDPLVWSSDTTAPGATLRRCSNPSPRSSAHRQPHNSQSETVLAPAMLLSPLRRVLAQGRSDALHTLAVRATTHARPPPRQHPGSAPVPSADTAPAHPASEYVPALLHQPTAAPPPAPPRSALASSNFAPRHPYPPPVDRVPNS